LATKTKNTPSKTLNPLHFEDLEPHRFEDLVRQLIYDYRDWQSIEATGRAGGDDGFDIRAWEKVEEVTNQDDENEDNIGQHPMDGNLWMIQCKREKVIGPTKVSTIVNDGVENENPPYGYILVAPVNFSKKSYDVFRETLRSKGVIEFYLWGKAELEDMLSLPKNDRILFTFFGISFVVRRRSKSSEVKFQINNKNKLLRILNEGQHTQDMYKTILIRDVNDENYPWKERYKDFDEKPRWVKHLAFGFHPRGLLIHIRKFFAYIDINKKVFDFTEKIDIVYRETNLNEHDPQVFIDRQLVNNFWKYLPRENQAYFVVDGMILYEDMLVIDDKGDIYHNFPHIFLDLQSKKNLFGRVWEMFQVGDKQFHLRDENYKRVKVFPSVFKEMQIRNVYKDRPIQWDQETLRQFNTRHDQVTTLFDIDKKYNFLKPRDAILVPSVKLAGDDVYLEITHKYKTTIKEYIEKHDGPFVRESIERQVGRKVDDNEKIDILEFDRTYGSHLKNKK
jgi:hypothetical protein